MSIEDKNISLALERINILNWEEVTLSEAQRDQIARLSPQEKERRKKEFLVQQEEAKKSTLRRWIRDLENDIAFSGLPADIKARILEFTATAEARGLDPTYIKATLAELTAKVKEESTQLQASATIKADTKPGAVLDTGATAAVIGGAVLAPFVQVRYTPEEYEKRSQHYIEEKVLPRLVENPPLQPVEPQRTYRKKQGSQYPKAMLKAEEAMEKKIQAEMIHVLRDEYAKAGKPIPSDEKLNQMIELMPGVQKRHLRRYTLNQKPTLKAEQIRVADEQAKIAIEKGIKRLRRKKQEKAEKTARFQKRMSQKIAAELTKKMIQKQEAKTKSEKADRLLKARKVVVTKKARTKEVKALQAETKSRIATILKGKTQQPTPVKTDQREEAKPIRNNNPIIQQALKDAYDHVA